MRLVLTEPTSRGNRPQEPKEVKKEKREHFT